MSQLSQATVVFNEEMIRCTKGIVTLFKGMITAWEKWLEEKKQTKN